MLLGLEWLSRHQDADGGWDADGFMRHDPVGDRCGGAGRLKWVDSGVTGLVLSAFLGAGYTQRHGPARYRQVVRRAMRYLGARQGADGLIGGTGGHYLYNHAICTMALCEGYGMTRSPMLRGMARKALAYLVAARSDGKAWRYAARDGESDVSVTGWCVMAMKSAMLSELDVPGMDRAYADAQRFIESMTDRETGVTGYRRRPAQGSTRPTSSRFRDEAMGVDTSRTHATNHTPTAIATISRVFFGYGRDDPRLRAGARLLAQHPPNGADPKTVDPYYWYYGALAMFQIGGEGWKRWLEGLEPALVGGQKTKGAARGSWDPVGAWGFAGGRVYATAINTLTLQIYFRYARVSKRR